MFVGAGVVLSGGVRSVAVVPGQGLWENAVGQAGPFLWAVSPLVKLAAPATCPGAERARIRRCRSCPPISPRVAELQEVLMGRSIGLDVHRDFCEVAVSDGDRARSAGRIATDPEQLELVARSLAPDDRVVLEATGNALAIARILERQSSPRTWCSSALGSPATSSAGQAAMSSTSLS